MTCLKTEGLCVDNRIRQYYSELWLHTQKTGGGSTQHNTPRQMQLEHPRGIELVDPYAHFPTQAFAQGQAWLKDKGLAQAWVRINAVKCA